MELVWYRMLGPLLGGSVFTFGLILAVALAGIGLGGVAYSLRGRSAPTLQGFAWTCVLESLCVGVPYGLGDRVAVLAALLRPVGDLSFGLRVGIWCVVTSLVVLPTAFVCGVQFPLLMGLLGRGRRDVGRDVGRAYAANTAGSIAGSLAGGFGLIPHLTAPGCWRLVGGALLVVGVTAGIVSARRSRPLALALLVPVVLATALLFQSVGPTVAWRDSPIGAGRVDAAALRTPNGVTAWEHERRRAIAWEVDGRESTVALETTAGLAFIVNGKNDGAARGDAGTAVMSGLLGAMLHPNPTRALVIGLGTGETAGWLAAVPAIADVDVYELEPAILEVARRSAPVNHDALENPKVHVEIGDARELLVTSGHTYSLVMSEPSNPYRAGVASLFTKSYYEAIKGRLQQDGLFLQWVQAYDVDASTVRTVYATLASVFPEVETWELGNSDLLLVASRVPVQHDRARLAARLGEEPYRSASRWIWRAEDPEALLAHFVATAGLARTVAEEQGEAINTDDQNLVEFGFAHAVGSGTATFSIEDIRRVARARREDRAAFIGQDVEWAQVDEDRVAFKVADETLGPDVHGPLEEGARAHRIAALRAFAAGDMRAVVSEWRAQGEPPRGLSQSAFLAFALADLGDPGATPFIESLRTFDACEADALLAHLRVRQRRFDEATAALEATFVALRTDPWPMDRMIRPAFADARALASADPSLAARLYAALRQPFVLRLFDAERERAAFAVALRAAGPECESAAAELEPNTPWNESFLRARYDCLRARSSPRVAVAEADLRRFLAAGPPDFAAGLHP